MLLVANKVDLTYNRRVNGQEGYQLAEELKVGSCKGLRPIQQSCGLFWFLFGFAL